MTREEKDELAAAMAPPVPVVDFENRRINAPAIVLSRLAFLAVTAALQAPPRLQTRTVGVKHETVQDIRDALTSIGFDWKQGVEQRQREERAAERAAASKRRKK